MDNLLYSYQHFPLSLSQAVKIGFFSVSYYSLMYILGFAVAYLLLAFRIKKGESNILSKNLLADFLIYCFIGLLIGARLGEVLFYNTGYYLQNPLAVISPFDPATHEFIGIYGMSYHGGLIGVLAAAFVFVKRYKIDFWLLSDAVVPVVPAGYFFGRIGNFINNELYGRITEKSWGMYFKDDLLNLRHPSQLYEAFLEGAVLFVILWCVREKRIFQGYFLSLYLSGYAFFRFFCEFFREPEGSLYLSGFFTLGQIFSLAMIFLAISIAIFKKSKKGV